MAFYRTKVLGLTGPTGCGKTLASLFLEKAGFSLINADEIVKYLYLNCSELVRKIGLKFDVVRGGTIDKKKLAQIVFSSEVEKVALEKIVWPFVLAEIKHRIEKNEEFNVVLDAPLLFESGASNFCDKTLAVLSNRQNRLFRILKRDGLTKKEALSRINSQQPDSFYADKADFLIFNNGLKENLFRRLQCVLNELKIKF